MEIFKELTNPASKEFEKLLNSQLSKVNIEEGKIINGKINKITEKFDFLFIEGLKSEPVLDINELKTMGLTDKIKIGFISQFFSDHTIAKLFKGIIYKLNKEIFEVYVFHSNRTLPGKMFNEINESVVSYNFENIILPKDFYEK